MYEKAGYCGALLFLAYLTKFDIKYKRIPAAGVMAFGILSIIYFMAEGQFRMVRMVFCMLPGMLLLMLARITGEKVGYGDGVTVLVLGLFLREFYCMAVLCFGIMMTGVYSLYRLFKKNREPIPLIPFLLIALEVVFVYV
ncbi:MAG: prepilin peptidase [Suilimivivens sp.]